MHSVPSPAVLLNKAAGGFVATPATRATGLPALICFVGRPALILGLPSLYLLLAYPPLWKDVDAIFQLTWAASDWNILHYPPLYCFLGRLPLEAGYLLAAKPLTSLFAAQAPTLGGAYLLIVAQHLLLISALTYTVCALASNPRSRCVLALILSCCSCFYTHAQCCGSEALSVPALLTLLGATARVAHQARRRDWLVYAAALFFAAGTRHINLVFTLTLPVALASLQLFKREPRGPQILLAILIGVFCLAANELLAFSLIHAFHDQYRSTLGRTLSDRVARFLGDLPERDRENLSHQLARRALDPEVRMAILAEARFGSFYKGGGSAIAQGLLLDGVSPQSIPVERDRVLLAATKAYLRSGHPVLISQIWRDLHHGLTVDNASIAQAPFSANLWGAQDRLRHPEMWERLRSLPSTTFPQAGQISRRASRDFYLLLGRFNTTGLQILCFGTGIAVLWIRQRIIAPRLFIAFSALLTGTLAFLANMLCVYYMSRYALPLFACSVFALLALLEPQLALFLRRLRLPWPATPLVGRGPEPLALPEPSRLYSPEA